MKRVLLCGKGELCVRALHYFKDNADYRVEAVCPVVPEPHWCSSLTTAARRTGMRVIESGDFRDYPEECVNPDILVSIYYDRIFTDDFLRRCGMAINLHNAPLPEFRGVRPINHAMRLGRRVHGVTIHQLLPGDAIDAGPIIGQVTFSIHPKFEEVRDIYNRCLRYGWILFEQTMPVLNRIKPENQDASKVIHFTHKDDHRLGDRIGWTRSET